MKKFLLLAALAAFVGGCGAEWADCPTCDPGEDSAEADDGTQIPVVVNVNVDVNQTQNQGQGQGQTQTQTNNPPVTNPPAVDAGTPSTPDAGSPPKVDAGTPSVCDAGTPTKCRRVCVRYEERQHCDRGWHGTDHKGRCNPKPKKHKKCVEEAVKCS